MVNSGLQADLSAALRNATASKDTVEIESSREDGDSQFAVRLKMQPFVASDVGNDFVMIHFQDIEDDAGKPIASTHFQGSGESVA